MTKRQYILASDPFTRPSTGRPMREVMEREGDGPWMVRLIVASEEAAEVLEALRRAYQDGREDHAEDAAERERNAGNSQANVFGGSGAI